MSGQIKVDYKAVYAKVAETMMRIYVEIEDMDATHRQALVMLEGMDSSTNAALTEAVARTQVKIKTTAEAMCKLLLSIDRAAQRMEEKDQKLKTAFNAMGGFSGGNAGLTGIFGSAPGAFSSANANRGGNAATGINGSGRDGGLSGLSGAGFGQLGVFLGSNSPGMSALQGSNGLPGLGQGGSVGSSMFSQLQGNGSLPGLGQGSASASLFTTGAHGSLGGGSINQGGLGLIGGGRISPAFGTHTSSFNAQSLNVGAGTSGSSTTATHLAGGEAITFNVGRFGSMSNWGANTGAQLATFSLSPGLQELGGSGSTSGNGTFTTGAFTAFGSTSFAGARGIGNTGAGSNRLATSNSGGNNAASQNRGVPFSPGANTSGGGTAGQAVVRNGQNTTQGQNSSAGNGGNNSQTGAHVGSMDGLAGEHWKEIMASHMSTLSDIQIRMAGVRTGAHIGLTEWMASPDRNWQGSPDHTAELLALQEHQASLTQATVERLGLLASLQDNPRFVNLVDSMSNASGHGNPDLDLIASTFARELGMSSDEFMEVLKIATDFNRIGVEISEVAGWAALQNTPRFTISLSENFVDTAFNIAGSGASGAHTYVQNTLAAILGMTPAEAARMGVSVRGDYTIFTGQMNRGFGTRFLTSNLRGGNLPIAARAERYIRIQPILRVVGPTINVAGGAVVTGRELFFENQDVPTSRRVGYAVAEVGMYAGAAYVGKKMGTAAGAFVGQIAIPIPGVGAGIGATVGAGVGILAGLGMSGLYNLDPFGTGSTRDLLREQVGNATEGISEGAQQWDSSAWSFTGW